MREYEGKPNKYKVFTIIGCQLTQQIQDQTKLDSCSSAALVARKVGFQFQFPMQGDIL